MNELRTQLELIDSRRLTGANLFWDWPAAIIDVRYSSVETEEFSRSVTEAWRTAARTLLSRVGHGREQTTHRLFEGGASYLISAPIDALYSMCELNEVAWAVATAQLTDTKAPDLATECTRLKALFKGESRPSLLALHASAQEHDVPFLWDDDEVSIGYGATARTWPIDRLPNPADVDWNAVGALPLALVTGTNGKSTTVRMAASIIAAAGLRAGLTSTDWIRVGKNILDHGDYSGTGGARTLMRHPDTEIAVLETARGGLLRRGLGVERADTALITNVAADHLGDYGINTVPELIEAKFIVRRALRATAPLLLNADDAGVVGFASTLEQTVHWFGLHPERAPLHEHLAGNGTAAYLESGWLVLSDRGQSRKIIAAKDIPAAIGGAARHNILNALGALLLCHQLGIPDAALCEGLAGFRGDEDDNPGRGNWFARDDVRILVDFAHNEHGMHALSRMLSQIPAQRKVLLMGQAGDRSDRDIASMTKAACAMHPDRLMACELPGHERGRNPMETPRIIREAAITAGLEPDTVELFSSPMEAAADALSDSRPGDLLVFLALSQRAQVLEQVHRFVEGTPDPRTR